MRQIKSIEEMNEVISGPKPSVLVWSANWCPDCLYLNDKLPAVVENNPEFEFVKMDRDQFIDQAIEMDILGIPSFVAYKDGKEISRFVSTLRKTPEEIQAYLDQTKEKCNG
ncbi:MAG: thioredoxin family protein [Erysipelotrichaceae bacterium]|nr:thioredoxin family protein [Erysipelotrichaceae bacterium]